MHIFLATVFPFLALTCHLFSMELQEVHHHPSSPNIPTKKERLTISPCNADNNSLQEKTDPTHDDCHSTISSTWGLERKNGTQERIEQYSESVGYDIEAIARGLVNFQKGLKPKCIQGDVDECELLLQIQSDLFEQKAAENKNRVEQFFNALTTKTALTEVVANKLYYEVLIEGTGSKMVKVTSEPLLHYVMSTFEDIKVTSTYDNGGPVNIPLCGTIPGFVKGVIGMREGERRRLYVHPDLAYKRGGSVPPNSVLIFDVAIIKIDG
jgi:FKBP-type peptidyl-prolyl cis-trans isomerase